MSPLGSQKVFCLGLSRTGTTALAEKLSSLGLRTIHYSLNAYLRMNELASERIEISSPRPGRYWNWAFQREVRAQDKISLVELLNRYDAFADLPFPLLYRELSVLYPDAYFVLTSRDDESWLNSMKWLLGDGHVLWEHGLLDDSLLRASYGGTCYDADKLLRFFHSHNRCVREHFRDSGRFLDLRLDRGDFQSTKLERFLHMESVNEKGIAKRNLQQSATWKARLKHRLAYSCAAAHFSFSAFNKMTVKVVGKSNVPSLQPNRH